MEETEEEKKNQNEISTSINFLKEKENENKDEKEEKVEKEETEKKEEKEDDKKINKENEKEEKSEGLTIEDLKNIILEPSEEEKEQNQEENIDKKDSGNLSRVEILESELSSIRKNNLRKYLMVNNQFKSSSSESEEEIVQKNIIKLTKCQLYKFVGRTLFVFLDRHENPLLIIGPHWPMYVCFCGIISIIMLVVYLFLWQTIGVVMRILGIICYWTYFISYTHCSLINPGYPENDEGRNFGHPRSEYHFCTLCHFYIKKNRYAHHCLDCDICIENQDHHCPWTGHCIGRKNTITFYIFIGASFCIIIYLASAVCIGSSSYN